jgi:4,5-dihydroxyphthalate decarboxylase
MALQLKTGMGSYGHFEALKSGKVGPENVEFEHMDVSPITSVFRRMCRDLEFDVAEMAITTYLTAKAYGLPFTAIPVFPVRAFHHGAAVYNTSTGITGPKDIEGKKMGVRAYTVTTGVWARGILADEYGLDLNKIEYVLADEEHVDAYHKDAPPNVHYQFGADLAKMLVEGELVAGIGVGRTESPDIKPLIANAKEADAKSYKDTGVYPINHTVVVKDSVIAENPWFVPALCEAYQASKEAWLSSASDEDKARAGGGLVEGDPFPYGVEKNRPALETIIRYAFEQKILPRRYAVEEIFASGSDLLD